MQHVQRKLEAQGHTCKGAWSRRPHVQKALGTRDHMCNRGLGRVVVGASSSFSFRFFGLRSE